MSSVSPENFKQQTSDLCESLSTHGIPSIIRSKYFLAKIFWSFLTVTSLICAIYFVVQSVLGYLEYNVLTQVRLVTNDSLEFPVVTICNRNQLATNHSVALFNKLNKPLLGFRQEAFDLFSSIEMKERRK